MVDNCYGEFVETIEPSDVGADMCVGSLIKKSRRWPCAKWRLYCRTQRLVWKEAAYRLTAPGLGKELGANLGVNRALYQGLFPGTSGNGFSFENPLFLQRIFTKVSDLKWFQTAQNPDMILFRLLYRERQKA